MLKRTMSSCRNFYPRPPRGGRRAYSCGICCILNISIHALREEGDFTMPFIQNNLRKFLSTPSARRATENDTGPWAQTQISIHALREEGDQILFIQITYRKRYFYPRPPRGGRRRGQQARGVTKVFLSTPSARRATLASPVFRFVHSNFYPRPPRGGRLTIFTEREDKVAISIHALREEGDSRGQQARGVTKVFLSTPSARRATMTNGDVLGAIEFLSTPSARRATQSAGAAWAM